MVNSSLLQANGLEEKAGLDFQKKILGPPGLQVFIFGRQEKHSSRQKLSSRKNS